jgi:hypothetical protein
VALSLDSFIWMIRKLQFACQAEISGDVVVDA